MQRILSDIGTIILDGEACEVHGIGFAGVKGFAGGFGEQALEPWGEQTIKCFVQEAIDETLKPILANVYLHYALDLWFEKVFKPRCGGEACLMRYADDFVCAFEREEDAQRFYREVGERLRRFGLELAAEKTRVMAFSGLEPDSGSFEFLGFEFYWGKDRRGRGHVKRRTSRKKLRSSLKGFTDWCKENRHLKLRVLFEQLNSKLRGYYNYYGVHGNYGSLKQFFSSAMRILMKWLNRRSQRRSYNWSGFSAVLPRWRISRYLCTGHRGGDPSSAHRRQPAPRSRDRRPPGNAHSPCS